MNKSKNKNGVSEDDMLTFGKYLQVATLLQHSNRIQLKYKLTAFTWFLATFIGIGYALSTLEVNLPCHPFLIVAVLCIASLCVIGIIWYLDIVVQEKNIASAVHHGLALENQHSFLPKTYHSVVQMSYLSGYVSTKSVFYIGLTVILILTICYVVASYLLLDKFTFWPVIIIGAIVAVPIVFALSKWITRSTDPYFILKKNHKKKEMYGNR